MAKPRIFVDLDEVLVGFTAGACRAHGTTLSEMLKFHEIGTWDIVPALSRALGDPSFSTDDFWQPINDGSPLFWEKLEPLPWAETLIDAVSEITDDWYIISAPSRSPHSHSGKVKWLQRFFDWSKPFDRFVLTPHKHIFAQSGTILIDDRETNIAAFVNHGGRGIVFPTLFNRLHAQADNPLQYVVDQLRIYTRE